MAFMASVTCRSTSAVSCLPSSLIAWQSMNPLALAECQHTDTHRGGRLGRTIALLELVQPSQHLGVIDEEFNVEPLHRHDCDPIASQVRTPTLGECA